MYRHCHRVSARAPSSTQWLPRLRYVSQLQSPEKVVLAIESSCDDSAVAVVAYQTAQTDTASSLRAYSLKTLFNKRITANNDAYGGIHPLVALHSHQASIAPLVQEALSDATVKHSLKERPRGVPDFVAVTRGPGMRSNLAIGLAIAKGLSTAWDVPLLGVHHMQAHALTPRLVSAEAFSKDAKLAPPRPDWPFLSVLASGGHSMLIDSTALTEHRILAETQDIAVGDCLDKAARAILPPELLRPPFGRALEHFAFDYDSNGAATPDYNYEAPKGRKEEIETRTSKWGWSLGPPLADNRRMEYSFSGLLSSVERAMRDPSSQGGRRAATTEELKALGREVQRLAFEHLASRILLHLSSLEKRWTGDTIVVSGGVASNQFLRHVLRAMLDARGYGHVKLSFPPIELCTDNALMIAWTGVEMYEAGYRSSLDILPIRKWSLDSQSDDGGIMGVDGWHSMT